MQVAKKSGIAPTTIYDWKYGSYKPKIDKIAKIAKVLDVPIAELIE